MSSRSAKAESTIRQFLARTNKVGEDVALDTSLFADGVGMDSLETAELSAMLEDELGWDPFSEGHTPQTIAELVSFYDEDAPAQ
jgi:acyl carrier protein